MRGELSCSLPWRGSAAARAWIRVMTSATRPCRMARDVVRDLAAEHGACIRPILLRRTNREVLCSVSTEWQHLFPRGELIYLRFTAVS